MVTIKRHQAKFNMWLTTNLSLATTHIHTFRARAASRSLDLCLSNGHAFTSRIHGVLDTQVVPTTSSEITATARDSLCPTAYVGVAQIETNTYDKNLAKCAQSKHCRPSKFPFYKTNCIGRQLETTGIRKASSRERGSHRLEPTPLETMSSRCRFQKLQQG